MSVHELNQRVMDQQRAADYEKTLLLLAALKAGTIGVDDYEMVPGGWRLVLEQPIPQMLIAGEPVTIEEGIALDGGADRNGSMPVV